MMSSPLDVIAPTACICYGPAECEGCVCGETERALRAYITKQPMPAMTPAQRAWCLSEIDLVEGYDRKDYEQETDAGVARGVLNAWTDFCRDKGLL